MSVKRKRKTGGERSGARQGMIKGEGVGPTQWKKTVEIESHD